MQFVTRWYECEHQGDLSRYMQAVQQAGGGVVRTQLDVDAEEGSILVEAPDREAFIARLGETEMGEFCYEAFHAMRG